MKPQEHRGVGPFAKRGHMKELNRKRRRKMIRRSQRFLSDLEKMAIKTTPKLIDAI
jgi:hypothetical protein